MALLLSYAQQQTIKPISANNQARYDQIAKEVEEHELRRLLGVAFLQDLQTNTTQTDNVKLLDGDSYEDCDGNTITHKGLRYVLAYMNYSRYIGEINVVDTFSGFVTKTRTDSESLSEGAIRRLQEENRIIAMTEWDNIRAYLDENTTTFTLWKGTYKKVYRPRIQGIRKVDYGR